MVKEIYFLINGNKLQINRMLFTKNRYDWKRIYRGCFGVDRKICPSCHLGSLYSMQNSDPPYVYFSIHTKQPWKILSYIPLYISLKDMLHLYVIFCSILKASKIFFYLNNSIYIKKIPSYFSLLVSNYPYSYLNIRNAVFFRALSVWTASSEFCTYRLCEQRRFRRACASAKSRQNLRCSLIHAVSQDEPSGRKPDQWPLWMTGHAQLKFVMTECSKTQIRLTGLSL